MTRRVKPAVAAVLLMAPAYAAAAVPMTPGDLAYCQALSSRYVRYVGHDEFSSRRLRDRGSIEAQVAVSQCRSGNSAAAIPVLERALTNAKVELPAR